MIIINNYNFLFSGYSEDDSYRSEFKAGGLVFLFACILIFPEAVIWQKITPDQNSQQMVHANYIESWLHSESFPNTNKERLPSSFPLFFWNVSGLWLRLSGHSFLVLCLTCVGLCSCVTENSFRRSRLPCQPMCVTEATFADFLRTKPVYLKFRKAFDTVHENCKNY